MTTTTILLLVVAGAVVLFAVLLFSTARRRDESRAVERAAAQTGPQEAEGPSGREVERAAALARRQVVLPGTTTPPAPRGPLDPEALGVTRRQFLNRSIVSVFGVGLGGFGAAMLAQLWPNLSGGFGSRIRAGDLEEVLQQIRDKKEPYYVAAGRFYLAPFPKEAVAKAKEVTAYSAVLEGYEAGVAALYQKCVHLGCRVPWCQSSQWFECPCHGSQYNRVGEKKAGPAPRGLDRFAVAIQGGSLVVDTSQVIEGPPVGTNTTGQEAEGPHCVGGGADH